MSINKEAYQQLIHFIGSAITLVAVSKTKPVEDIQALYDLGQRDFGENYVQELVEKAAKLPPDIRWHFIGHLQTNKVKQLAGVVQLIHGVDSLKLLEEINKEGAKRKKIIECLLQVHVAREETKFGLDEKELAVVLKEFDSIKMNNVTIRGLMGMASFTDDNEVQRKEFQQLKTLFESYKRKDFNILSMGMSADYKIALEEGSSMIRVGSLLFGERPG